MTDNFLKSLDAIDSTMPAMIELLLDLKVPSQKTLLVLIIKRFVHSLGKIPRLTGRFRLPKLANHALPVGPNNNEGV
jgi:hypothetical protein